MLAPPLIKQFSGSNCKEVCCGMFNKKVIVEKLTLNNMYSQSTTYFNKNNFCIGVTVNFLKMLKYIGINCPKLNSGPAD